MAEPMDVDSSTTVDLQQWAREEFGEGFINGGEATDKDILSAVAFSHKRWAQIRFRFLHDHQRGDPTFGANAIPSISEAASNIRESANAMVHQAHMVDDLINTRIRLPQYTYRFKDKTMPSEAEYSRMLSTLFGISYRLTTDEAWAIVSFALRPSENLHATIPDYMRNVAIPFLESMSTFMCTLKDLSYKGKTKNSNTYEYEYCVELYSAWDTYNDLLVEVVRTSQIMGKPPRATPGRGDDWSEYSRNYIGQLIFAREGLIDVVKRCRNFDDVKEKLSFVLFPFHWTYTAFERGNSLIPAFHQLPDLPAQRVAPWQQDNLAWGLTMYGAHTLRAAATLRGGPPLGTLGPPLGDASGPAGQSYASGIGTDGPDWALKYWSTTLDAHVAGLYVLPTKLRTEDQITNMYPSADRGGDGGGWPRNPNRTLDNGYAGPDGGGGGNTANRGRGRGGNTANRGGGRGGNTANRGGGRGGNTANRGGGRGGNQANRGGGGGHGGGPLRTGGQDTGRNVRRRTGGYTWNNMAQGQPVAYAARVRAARVADIAMDPAYSSRRAARPAAERSFGISWDELERQELEEQGISYGGGYNYGYEEEDEEEDDDDKDDEDQFVRLHGRPRGITRTAAAEGSLAERKRLAEEIGMVPSRLGKRRRI